jgi:ElaB/YqjD/DUF883 family membrane-anchored ribosome-binding protein
MSSHQHDQDRTKKDPEQIEAEIERTRGAIGQQLGAIGEKLSPDNLKHEAKGLFDDAKEATVEKLREVKDDALKSVSETVEEVSDRARRAGVASYEYARSNAIPLGLIGLGVGLMFMRSTPRRRRTEYEYDYPVPGGTLELGEVPEPQAVRRPLADARERAKDVSRRARHEIDRRAEQARGRARELGQRARTGLVRAEETAVDFTRENPLAVGAAALAAGVAIGLLLPSTRREDEMLGKTRDHLLGEVRGGVEGVGRVAKEAARDVQSALKQP